MLQGFCQTTLNTFQQLLKRSNTLTNLFRLRLCGLNIDFFIPVHNYFLTGFGQLHSYEGTSDFPSRIERTLNSKCASYLTLNTNVHIHVHVHYLLPLVLKARHLSGCFLAVCLSRHWDGFAYTVDILINVPLKNNYQPWVVHN